MRKLMFTMLAYWIAGVTLAQDYSNANEQANRLQTLVKNYPQLASLKSLTKTNGGKDIWLLT